jgi:hypothetical protein
MEQHAAGGPLLGLRPEQRLEAMLGQVGGQDRGVGFVRRAQAAATERVELV